MMKLMAPIIFLLAFASVQAQDVTAIMKDAERLETLPNEKAALARYKDVLKIQPLNVYSLNKASELCSRIGKRQKKCEDE